MHQSEQLQENIVTIVHQPLICKQSAGFGALNRETTLPVTENVGQIQKCDGVNINQSGHMETIEESDDSIVFWG